MRIDEDDFLDALFPKLTADPTVAIGPGDDCAALEWTDDQLLLIAVDQVAAGIHYFAGSATATPPALAGRKLLARNISDIAAMGGRPSHALLAVAVTPDRDREWVDAFTDGILELAKTFDVHLIGGDLAVATADVAGLTILGTVARTAACRRSGACPDDHIFVTGEFGGSLETEKHLTFTPRVEEGAWLAESGFTHVMIDVSDGLLKDLGRLCRASGVQAIVDKDSVPRTSIGSDRATLNQAMLDGEDYELIFAVASKRAGELEQAWPFATPLTAIGRFADSVAGQPAIVTTGGDDLNGRYRGTYDHFVI